MTLLVVNAGSSTLKLKSFARDPAVAPLFEREDDVDGDHDAALARALSDLPHAPAAIAHRVVHAGDELVAPVRIDANVERAIAAWSDLAPLHNRAALRCIAAARGLGVPQIAVFDTEFCATQPDAARAIALPARFGPRLRRYGFHGLSHRSMRDRVAARLHEARPTFVSMHLGSGCSVAAIEDGACVDASMGFSPLGGLVMGTRPGDLDPAIVPWLLRSGRTLDEVEHALHHESGLHALAGTADVRAILARDDAAARLALDVFCRSARKALGAAWALLRAPRAVAFTGGVGQRSARVRARVLADLDHLGIELDAARNEAGAECITTSASRVQAFVLAADEERLVAADAWAVLESA